MNTIVSSIIPFPSIMWWGAIIQSEKIIFDKSEHFRKMTYLNRYKISGSNNPILLSIPLITGRNQRASMDEVKIFNNDNWQVRHWRSLVSVYKRTPFFEYYEPELKQIFETEFISLIDFNLATLMWVKTQLKLKFEHSFANSFLPQYPEVVRDIRFINFDNTNPTKINFPRYYQVFEDRIGFQPNLSILDLLFSEGPQTTDWIKDNILL